MAQKQEPPLAFPHQARALLPSFPRRAGANPACPLLYTHRPPGVSTEPYESDKPEQEDEMLKEEENLIKVIQDHPFSARADERSHRTGVKKQRDHHKFENIAQGV